MFLSFNFVYLIILTTRTLRYDIIYAIDKYSLSLSDRKIATCEPSIAPIAPGNPAFSKNLKDYYYNFINFRDLTLKKCVTANNKLTIFYLNPITVINITRV